MENSKNLLRAFFAIAATVFMANSASAAGVDLSDFIEDFGCDAIGGIESSQPDGSPITTCCTPLACYICDANGKDCDKEDDYREPVTGRLSKPVLKPGTMVMPPDTNTTIGTPAKPIARTPIMQNQKRN